MIALWHMQLLLKENDFKTFKLFKQLCHRVASINCNQKLNYCYVAQKN